MGTGSGPQIPLVKKKSEPRVETVQLKTFGDDNLEGFDLFPVCECQCNKGFLCDLSHG